MKAGVALLLLAALGMVPRQPAQDWGGKGMNPEEIFLHWIESIERIPPAGFQAIHDIGQIPDPPAGDSLYWCGQLFLPGTGPYASGLVTIHSFHLARKYPGSAIDLLRHEYSSLGRLLVVSEGVNFVLIRFKADTVAAGSQDLLKLAEETAQHLLTPRSPDAKWVFKRVSGAPDGTVLSTNPSVQPGSIAAWSERVDLLIRGTTLYILCYKRRPSIVGFRHDAQWFPDDFRMKFSPKAP